MSTHVPSQRRAEDRDRNDVREPVSGVFPVARQRATDDPCAVRQGCVEPSIQLLTTFVSLELG
jgi:hypothetical protein